MSKVLLAITSDSKNTYKLDEMIAPFEEEGYHVHFFEDLGDIELVTLPKLIEYINKYENTDIERFVFISDIKELVFAWYRCYNHLVDDFIYCITIENQNSPFILTTTYNDFCRKLASFDGASEETLFGKIYININLENYKYISGFLLTNNRFQYFNRFSDFNFLNKTEKKEIHKNYHFRQKSYSFEVGTKSNPAQENIQFTGPREEFLISNNIHLFTENYYFIPYGSLILVNWTSLSINEIKFYISSILSAATELPLEVKTSIYENVSQAILLDPLNDEMEILFLYNFISFKLNTNMNEMTLRRILDTRFPGEYLFPILMSMMAGLKEEDVRNYIHLYDDYQAVMRKIVVGLRNGIHSKKTLYTPNNKKIAFLIGQMLTSLHSPTSVIVNYAKNLKKFYPDYQIQIFVSDAFVYPDSELIFNRYYKSEPSEKCKNLHKELLAHTDITIHYSNHLLPRTQRLQNELDAIHNFDPGLIFDLDGYNLVKEFLYEDFPILEFSMGAISRSEHSDIYISGRDESDVYNLYKRHGLSHRTYYKHNGGVDFSEPKRTILRNDYNLADDHFVMITVGNRLLAEIDETFIDLVVSFLDNEPNAKWLIVGLTQLPLLANKYPDIVEKNVIFIQLERDLAALYKTCDVYLNPFRAGGGYSAGMAMKQSLPVLALAEKSDVEIFIGVENCVSNTTEYLVELNKIYRDRDYALVKGQLMKKRLEEEFSFKPAIDEIIHFFELTKIEFQKRKN